MTNLTPTIVSFVDSDGTLSFTVKNLNVSLANALRRVILSDIPIYCFRTFPHEENKVNITTNTSRLNNEILKQRIGCVPIHLKMNDPDFDDFDVKNYRVVLDVQNNSSSIMYVTTKDFKIVNVITGKELSDSMLRRIFPPNTITNDFILLCRLIPKMTQSHDGERVALTAEIGVGCARMDGMYNVVGTCSYRATPNIEAATAICKEREKKMVSDGVSPDEIAFEKKNWFNLEALRYVHQDQYDFLIESVGVYSNTEILKKAISILIEKFQKFIHDVENDTTDVKIMTSQTTLSNGYDVVIQNEDYTLGCCIEYFIHKNQYINEKNVSYCGFRKNHPHDTESVIRIGYYVPTPVDLVATNLINAANHSIEAFQKLFSTVGLD
jgi:DNA-directed RNA polymerase subunit L